MNFPHGKMVTVISTNADEDEYGDVTTDPTESRWGPCAIAPRTSAEATDSRTPAVVVGLTVYGPPRTIKPSDQLRIDGVVYEIDGEPGDWSSPFTGWHPGIEVAIKRAKAATS